MISVRSDAEKIADQQRIAADYQASVNARRQSRDGVVVTPVAVVDFQIRSALESLREMGRDADDGVEWLDPFGGTGIYTARLLQIAPLSPSRKMALAANCVVIEIDPHAAQVCADNLANVVFEETGRYREVRVLCCDTFALDPNVDLWDSRFNFVRPTRIEQARAAA